MILEGIVTSQNARGDLNIAPMGPIVEPDMSSFLLRPFQTSTTFGNLKLNGCGILHVVDDVLLLAEAAISRIETSPATFAAITIPGRVLRSACRWYEFRVESLDDSQLRSEIRVRVTNTGRIRDFFGFNRAKHAVIEAAILATRVHMLDAKDIVAQFAALRSPVEKTAGPRERKAFELLNDYVTRSLSNQSGDEGRT